MINNTNEQSINFLLQRREYFLKKSIEELKISKDDNLDKIKSDFNLKFRIQQVSLNEIKILYSTEKDLNKESQYKESPRKNRTFFRFEIPVVGNLRLLFYKSSNYKDYNKQPNEYYLLNKNGHIAFHCGKKTFNDNLHGLTFEDINNGLIVICFYMDNFDEDYFNSFKNDVSSFFSESIEYTNSEILTWNNNLRKLIDDFLNDRLSYLDNHGKFLNNIGLT